MREGGCQCGQVRFRAEGKPLNVWLCHCAECQKSYSAPFNARAFFLGPQVETSGDTVSFATSERLERVSCAGSRNAASGPGARTASAMACRWPPSMIRHRLRAHRPHLRRRDGSLAEARRWFAATSAKAARMTTPAHIPHRRRLRLRLGPVSPQGRPALRLHLPLQRLSKAHHLGLHPLGPGARAPTWKS